MNNDNPVEFIIPSKVSYVLWQEHLNRYVFSLGFVRNSIVLDIACGTGYGAAIMSDIANFVVGADISRKALGYAKKHYGKTHNATFIMSDARCMPFRNNMFDTIVSFETIEHVIPYERFLYEVKRVLNKRGYFIISTPNKKLTSYREGKQRNPFHVREFNAAEFSQLLTAFFTDFQLYGQHYFTANDWLFGIVQGYISFISFPNWLKGLLKLGTTLRKPKDQRRTRRETSWSATDPSYGVKKFRDFYPILTPAFLIAVTKK